MKRFGRVEGVTLKGSARSKTIELPRRNASLRANWIRFLDEMTDETPTCYERVWCEWWARSRNTWDPPCGGVSAIVYSIGREDGRGRAFLRNERFPRVPLNSLRMVLRLALVRSPLDASCPTTRSVACERGRSRWSKRYCSDGDSPAGEEVLRSERTRSKREGVSASWRGELAGVLE